MLGAYEVAAIAATRSAASPAGSSTTSAELDLSLGVRPVRRARSSSSLARAAARAREQAFLAAAVALSFWLVLEVAAFASDQSLRVEERNMFYVAPLFLIALLLWIERGAPRPRGDAAIAAASAAGSSPSAVRASLSA